MAWKILFPIVLTTLILVVTLPLAFMLERKILRPLTQHFVTSQAMPSHPARAIRFWYKWLKVDWAVRFTEQNKGILLKLRKNPTLFIPYSSFSEIKWRLDLFGRPLLTFTFADASLGEMHLLIAREIFEQMTQLKKVSKKQ